MEIKPPTSMPAPTPPETHGPTPVARLSRPRAQDRCTLQNMCQVLQAGRGRRQAVVHGKYVPASTFEDTQRKALNGAQGRRLKMRRRCDSIPLLLRSPSGYKALSASRSVSRPTRACHCPLLRVATGATRLQPRAIGYRRPQPGALCGICVARIVRRLDVHNVPQPEVYGRDRARLYVCCLLRHENSPRLSPQG